VSHEAVLSCVTAAHPGERRGQEYILHALSQPRPHPALEAEAAERHALRAEPGGAAHAAHVASMLRVRSVSHAMCAAGPPRRTHALCSTQTASTRLTPAHALL